jgi:ribosomal protein S18 acetylase RimI-like enzyme
VPAPAIREARSSDAAAVADLVIRSWRAAYPGMVEQRVLDDLALPEQTEKWREVIEGRMNVLVATAEHAIVGVVAIAAPTRDTDEWKDVAELAAVYADPDHFRSGIGNALLNHAIELLSEERWREVTVWTLNNNHRALAFYQGFGFKRDGALREETDWHEPDVRLRRRLLA